MASDDVAREAARAFDSYLDHVYDEYRDDPRGALEELSDGGRLYDFLKTNYRQFFWIDGALREREFQDFTKAVDVIRKEKVAALKKKRR